MPNTYDVGDAVELTGTFTVADTGLAIDPDTVTLTVKNPSGEEFTYTYANSELTRVSAGVYRRVIYPNMWGRWYYGWYGTKDNNPMVNEELWLEVRRPKVTVPSV